MRIYIYIFIYLPTSTDGLQLKPCPNGGCMPLPGKAAPFAAPPAALLSPPETSASAPEVRRLEWDSSPVMMMTYLAAHPT